MNPAQSNARRILTLSRRLEHYGARVRIYTDGIESPFERTDEIRTREKRARTLALKVIMSDARELYLRVSGLWAKGIRK